MSGRRRNNKNARITEPFALMPLSLFQSPAYQALSPPGNRVLTRLIVEHLSHGGFEYGRLKCTYGDFEEAGVRRRSIAPAIRECEELGLVEVVKRGTPSISAQRQPSQYRLTFLQGRDQGGTIMPTDEWRKIETREQADQCLARAGAIKSAPHVRRATVARGKRSVATMVEAAQAA